MLSFIDIIILFIICGFVFFGFFFGLVQTLGNLIGTVVGVYFASRAVSGKDGGSGKIISFIFLFFIASRAVGIVFWFIGKVVNLITWLPFAGPINRLLGALFGLIEGVVAVGVVLYFAQKFLPGGVVEATLHASIFAKYLIAMATAMQVLYPESLRS